MKMIVFSNILELFSSYEDHHMNIIEKNVSIEKNCRASKTYMIE